MEIDFTECRTIADHLRRVRTARLAIRETGHEGGADAKIEIFPWRKF